MHELALAEALVAIAEEHACGCRVGRIELQVGRLRQVVPDALAFSLELVAQGTLVEGAELTVEQLPACVSCRACGAQSEVDGFPLACGSCGGLRVEVISGEQFRVVALELEVEAVAAVRR